MWANDFRFSSHVSHFWTLLPIAKLAFSTLGLCQYTPSGVGTCPTIFVAIRFISAPLTPVISAGGIRVVLVMSPPLTVVLNMRHRTRAGCDRPRRYPRQPWLTQSWGTPTSSRPAPTTRRTAWTSSPKVRRTRRYASGCSFPRDQALGRASGCARRTRGHHLVHGVQVSAGRCLQEAAG